MLLDEHLDRRLKPMFDSRFEVVTVHEHGWTGKRNGVLLQAAQAEFDVLVTMDRSIEYQQNLQKLALAVIVLRASPRSGTMPLAEWKRRSPSRPSNFRSLVPSALLERETRCRCSRH